MLFSIAHARYSPAMRYKKVVFQVLLSGRWCLPRPTPAQGSMHHRRGIDGPSRPLQRPENIQQTSESNKLGTNNNHPNSRLGDHDFVYEEVPTSSTDSFVGTSFLSTGSATPDNILHINFDRYANVSTWVVRARNQVRTSTGMVR